MKMRKMIVSMETDCFDCIEREAERVGRCMEDMIYGWLLLGLQMKGQGHDIENDAIG